MPNLISQAIGPVIGAILIDQFNPDAVMICVALLAIANVAITLMLWRSFSKVTSNPVPH
jgi:predicted MFS family arabinose efflux permease